MKHLLAVFTAYLCCSFVLNMTRISLTSASSSTMLTSQRHKSTLKAGELLRSRNGKFEVKMRKDCNLVITKTESKKPIWATNTKGKGEECYARILHNGIFMIKNKKNQIVWTSQSILKRGRHGPYVVKITNKGNLTIQNNLKKYIWGAFGIPLPKKVKKALKIPSQKSVGILLGFLEKIRRKMKRHPPTQPFNMDPRKKVKNILPKIVNKPPKKKDDIKPIKGKTKSFVALLKVWIKQGAKGWKKLKSRMKKKGLTKKRLIRKVKRAFNTGSVKKVLEVLAKIAKDKIAKKDKGANKKMRKKMKAKKKKILPVRAAIKKLTWSEKIKKIFASGKQKTRKGWRRIKKILKKNNFKGTKPWWKKLRKSVKNDSFNTFIKVLTVPPLPPVAPKVKVNQPPKVAKKPLPNSKPAPIKPIRVIRIRRWRLVLRIRWYLTYYWRRYWNWGRWCRRCWGCGWWWWRHTHCIWYWCPGWAWTPHWYWAYYYYWQWEYTY